MKRTRIFFTLGVLALALTFGLVLAGCDNGTTDDDKTIASELIGKWQVVSGTALNGQSYSQSYSDGAGYEFTSNSVTIYINSKVEGSGPSYTEGNTVYNLAGVVAFTWSIDGYGKLTIVVTQNGGSGQEVLEKVDKFKWE